MNGPHGTSLAQKGSGSLEKDSTIYIIAMKEEQETGFEHDLGLGKREGHADKAGQPLAQRVVPPLDMGGSPLSLPTAVCCSSGMTEAYTEGIS